MQAEIDCKMQSNYSKAQKPWMLITSLKSAKQRFT